MPIQTESPLSRVFSWYIDDERPANEVRLFVQQCTKVSLSFDASSPGHLVYRGQRSLGGVRLEVELSLQAALPGRTVYRIHASASAERHPMAIANFAPAVREMERHWRQTLNPLTDVGDTAAHNAGLYADLLQQAIEDERTSGEGEPG